MNQEEDCIFCKIIDGTLPSYKIFEDDDFIAFLDIEPTSRGHSMVIPKKHHRRVYDVPQFAEYWNVVLKITKMINETLMPEFVTYFTYGEDILHAHIQVIPRYDHLEKLLPEKIKMSKEELELTAGKIKNMLK